MAKILITRAEPAAGDTARKILALGHQAICCPIFELLDTGNKIPKTAYSGMVLTSCNAMEILEQHNWKPENLELPVFCVGPKTATRARGYGLEHIHQADGNAENLAEMITAYGFEDNTRLLYPAAMKRSFDMEATLTAENIKLDTIVIYEIKTITISKQTLFDKLAEAENGFLLVYSQRSGQQLRKIILDYNLAEMLCTITIVGISENAVSAVRDLPWGHIKISNQPNETSMLEHCI